MTIRVLAGMVALLCASAADAATVRSETRRYPTDGVRAVRLDFSVGELQIEPGEAPEVTVEVTVNCRGAGMDECLRRARRVRLTTERRDGVLIVRVKGTPRVSRGRTWLDTRVRVPQALDLDVDMDVGELHVRAIQGDVDLDLDIGELFLEMPREAVRSVDMRGFIGESTLRFDGRHQESVGVFGYHGNWDQGTGTSRVSLRCGIGEIEVRLD